MIQAIATTYAGIEFRSRLEADYAATFDSINLPWQYEPEGFKLSDGTWYSPDFYLSSARAWLEVKGAHKEGVDKVERFADDLWESAGQPDYESPTAPMVILARAPKDGGVDFSEFAGHSTPNFLGIRGVDKRVSLGLARCPQCTQRTFIFFWSRLCRACGYVHDDALDAWMSSVHDHYMTRFVRLARPAGKSHP